MISDDKEKKEVSMNFSLTQDMFIDNIRGIRRSIFDLIDELNNRDNLSLESFTKSINEIASTSQKSDNNETLSNENKDELVFRLIECLRKERPYNISNVILKSLFLNVFSEFDTFIGNLLMVFYSKRPELIQSSKKEVLVETVFQFGSLDEFKDYIVRDEVDKIKRESYVKQFNIFEKMFDVKLKNFKNWNNFVEITQRRNIVMHCDGIVTEQYIEICKDNECLEYELGKKLTITYDYLICAIRIIEEVAIKLLHVIWRKQFPNELEIADTALNNYIYELLDSDYKLALNISQFAIEQKKFSNKEAELYFLVNHCIALRDNNDENKMKEVIGKYDFSCVKNEFILAKEVLLKNYDKAYMLMKQIGDKSEIFKRNHYLKFPLFSEIQMEEEFVKVYNEIFKIQFKEELLLEFSEDK